MLRFVDRLMGNSSFGGSLLLLRHVRFPLRSSFDLLVQHTFETQKSPWNVSDVERRETGLFSEKTKTSLSGSFFNFHCVFSSGRCNSCVARA